MTSFVDDILFVAIFSNWIIFQSLAHEIGHSVGIDHDFKGGNMTDSRYDANGKKCINTGGIMDYAMTNENDQVKQFYLTGPFEQKSNQFKTNSNISTKLGMF